MDSWSGKEIASGSDDEVESVDSIERFAASKEPDPIARRMLIDFIRNRLTVPRSQHIFNHDLSKRSSGINKCTIIHKIWLVTDNMTAVPDIMEAFDRHQFNWMSTSYGLYGEGLAREFFVAYAATLLNSIIGESSGKKKKELISKLPLLEDV